MLGQYINRNTNLLLCGFALSIIFRGSVQKLFLQISDFKWADTTTIFFNVKKRFQYPENFPSLNESQSQHIYNCSVGFLMVIMGL